MPSIFVVLELSFYFGVVYTFYYCVKYGKWSPFGNSGKFKIVPVSENQFKVQHRRLFVWFDELITEGNYFTGLNVVSVRRFSSTERCQGYINMIT